MKIGILTGGGDCPGLNAVIRAVVRMAERDGHECVGFKDGWKGVLEGNFRTLTRKDTSGILHMGGTILGSSRTNPRNVEDGWERMGRTLRDNHIDALIAIGGEDTLGVARELPEHGYEYVVGCPKTIDNDLNGTDYTFGFDTAMNICTEAIDRLHSTAEAHQRIFVVEVMGRHAGWIALHAGIAGGADVIVIPEVELGLEEICEVLRRRHEQLERHFSIVVVSEGAHLKGEDQIASQETDAFGHARLGGIGEYVAKRIKETMKIDTRAVTLGHVQRGGTPTARDRYLATMFGIAAYRAAIERKWGTMAALRGTEMVAVSLAEATTEVKRVPPEQYHMATHFFG